MSVHLRFRALLASLILPVSVLALPAQPAAASSIVVTVNGTSVTATGGAGDDIIPVACGSGNVTVNSVATSPLLACGSITSLVVNGNDGNDAIGGNTIAGGAFPALTDVQLSGGAGNDQITGTQLVDQISGGAGNDQVNSGLGNDDVAGGAGSDGVTDDGGSTVVLTDTQLSGGGGIDSLSGIERASLVGTGGSDSFNATAFSGGVTTVGLGGSDLANGTSNKDTFTMGAGADIVNANGGADWITGGGDNDVLNGGPGKDLVTGSGGSYVLTDSSMTGEGSDALSNIEKASLTAGTGASIDASGFTGTTYQYGAGGAESLTGGKGRDFFTPGTGNDTVHGGPANDRASIAGTDVVVTDTSITGEGSDSISGIDSVWVVGGNAADSFDARTFSGTVLLDGIGGNDELLGGKGGDMLLGGAGNDQLKGALGNDTLNGGKGKDECIGGPGTNVLKSCELN